MVPSTIIKILIERPFSEVYSFLAEPLNFPSWASPTGGTIEPLGNGDWLADVPAGKLVMRFAPRNDFGVLDYQAFPQGAKARPVVPVRLYANGRGSDSILTMFQRTDVDDEQHASNVEWVRSDLERLKSLLETR